MKKYFTNALLCFSFAAMSLSPIVAFAQTAPRPKIAIPTFEYDRLKQEGKLDDKFDYILIPANNHNQEASDYINQRLGDDLNNLRAPSNPNETTLASSACSCLLPVDNTFSIAEFTNGTAPQYRNDDGSTAQKALPFTFCFYGTNFNNFFINNNGNVSFGASYTTFTSTGFPSNQVVMLAPFWADVDTRSGTNTPISDLVYYKITPTYVIVQWKNVGYYNSGGFTQGAHTDKRNTFQVIFTNGSDPILPPGNNVAFCYGDMQWTTGDASGGVNGFAGTASTVGLNKGDGVNYAQVGRFSTNTANFNGTTNTTSGVNWLDNKSFYFNSCNSTNIPPIVTGFTNCDTLKLCGANDTLILSGLFLSPEPAQTTTVTITSSTLPFTVLQNTPGNTSGVQIMILANPSLGGNHTITFTATDSGTPAGISTVATSVFIDTTGLAAFNPVILGAQALCGGSPTTVSVSPTNFSSYLWSDNSNGTSLNITSPGQYWVTSTLNGCSKTNIVNVVTVPLANFTYSSNTYCQSVQNINPAFGANSAAGTFSYVSSNGGTLVLNTSTGVVNIAGSSVDSYTVTNAIPTTAGCPPSTSTFVFSITSANNATFAYSNQQYCLSAFAQNQSPTFAGGGTGGTFSASSSNISVNPSSGVINLQLSSAGTYTITNSVSNGGACPPSTSSYVVTLQSPQSAAFSYPGSPFCQGGAAVVLPTMVGSSGVFYGSDVEPNLYLDSITGGINVTASAVGSYLITNVVASNGVCPMAIYNSVIEIGAPPEVVFNYANVAYCSNETNPSPNLIGNAVTGTFSVSPVGLFINASTGEINLGASAAGTYTVTNYILSNGTCPDVSSSFVVTVNTAVQSSFNYANTAYCLNANNPNPVFTNGGTAGAFTANGSGTISISNVTGEIDLAASTAGTYTITNFIPSVGACASSTSSFVVQLTQLPSAVFTYTANPFCANAGFALPSLGSGATSGLFSSVQGNLLINSSTGEVTLSSATGSFTVLNNIAAANGCPAVSYSTNLDITAPPVAVFAYTSSPYCKTSGNATPTFTSGPSVGGTFSAAPSGLVINPTTGLINVSLSNAGTYTVSLNYPAAGGCAAATFSSTVIITAPPLGVFNYSNSPYCTGGSSATPTVISGSINGGAFSASPSGLSIDPSTGIVTLPTSTANTYTVSLNFPAAGGCAAATFTSVISVLSAPVGVFSYANNPYCQTGPNTMPTFSVTPSPGGTFSATPSGLNLDSSTGLVNTSLSSVGTYTVILNYPAAGGCPAQTYNNVITIVQPSAAFSYSTLNYCQTGNTTANITGTTGGVFVASPSGLSINPTTGAVNLAASTLGSYVVTYAVSLAGCGATNSVNLIVNSIPSSSPANPQALSCLNNNTTTISIGSSSSGSNINYAWTNSSGTNIGNGSSAVVSNAGIYTLVVTNTLTGCSSSNTLTVNQTPLPVSTFTADPTSGQAPLAVNFTNQTEAGVSYAWSFGNSATASGSNPSYTYSQTGEYVVTLMAIDNLPCSSTYTLSIFVFEGFTMVVPNVFSPNGDGKNEFFVTNDSGVKSFLGIIYDRWGIKMHSWTDPIEGWDGRNKFGQNCADGTYFYVIKATGFDDVEREFKGSLLLIK
jgi:gliding motility-associated-like protein